ncbi:NAD-dependent epimerase/dehydratase family protein [Pseudoxanthomonas koreensis]|uniref:NAD-dependent epimerase/dehydratase family protein n=1 Tax=Pseudoxanthomonas koreensis TaxID=266061 RepID=UPI001390E11D|nr:NAD-dependent epimerase/dehydratase family protein [Pseudoxanthomonas koreensis]KAF1691585.1 NAD-dependent dehydratase [Pseudoxanthomonas koreensis]
MARDCILVTGGAGFIGCAISHDLTAGELPVVVVDNLHPQVHATRQRPEALSRHVHFIEGDVCDESVWGCVLDEWSPRKVVHLAAETGTGQSLTEASRHGLVNVIGTTRMLDAFAARQIAPERFVLTSSRAVYGEGEWERGDGGRYYPGQRSMTMLDAGQWDFEGAHALPFDARRTQPRPTSVYGATKLAQEHLLSAWALSFGSEVVVVRLQNVYGPGQSLNNPYTGIASLFTRMAKAGQSIPLYEDGLMRRDFIFIDDVASAVLQALSVPGASGGTFDIGTGLGTTIGDLAATIADHYGAPSPHVCGKYRNGDVRHASCNTESARVALDWESRISMSNGVGQLCTWIDKEMEG